MRAKQMGVPRLCPLGAFVYYTHRASSATRYSLRDLPRRDQRRVQRLFAGGGPYAYAEPLPVPGRYRSHKHDVRWVAVWPEAGYGTCVGLVHRSEGWVTHADEGSTYLSERERWPLYVVKRNLTEAGLLVPLWACVPLPQNTQDGIVGFCFNDEPPVLVRRVDDAGHVVGIPDAWDEYCTKWFTPGRVALGV